MAPATWTTSRPTASVSSSVDDVQRKCRVEPMSDPVPCLRRTEPSAALIPRSGQRTLAYVPAEQSDIRRRIHELNRSISVHPERSTDHPSSTSSTNESGLRIEWSRSPASDRASSIQGTDAEEPGLAQKRLRSFIPSPLRLKDLARVALVFARRRRHATAVQRAPEAMPVKASPRCMLPHEEYAEIAALSRLIGPTLRAALQRSALKSEK